MGDNLMGDNQQRPTVQEKDMGTLDQEIIVDSNYSGGTRFRIAWYIKREEKVLIYGPHGTWHSKEEALAMADAIYKFLGETRKEEVSSVPEVDEDGGVSVGGVRFEF